MGASLAFLAFGGLMVCGIPIALAIGVAALLVIFVADLGIDSVANLFQSGLGKYPLLAIPMFIFAGTVFDRSGMASRLLRLATAIVGTGPGSLAAIAVVVAIMMGGISGSGAAITATVAAIMTPAMLRVGYPRPFIASVVGSAASTDILVPPSISLIMYSLMVPAAPMNDMFMAGLIPGTLAGLALIIPAYFLARNYNFGAEVKAPRPPFWLSLREASWALFAKVLILGGLRLGFFTPTEAGVVAIVYGIFVGAFIYREIDLKKIPAMVGEAAELTSVIMIVMGFAGVFGWVVNTIGVVDPIVAALAQHDLNQHVVLGLIIALLMVIGLFLDAVPILLIIVPLLVPIAAHFSWDMTWFGIIVVMMIAVGQVTPPMAVNLMVACKIVDTPIESTVRYTVWLLLGMFTVLLLIIIFPDIALWLPRYAGTR
jgi:C4-dicarboxylate transporter DctM subunit